MPVYCLQSPVLLCHFVTLSLCHSFTLLPQLIEWIPGEVAARRNAKNNIMVIFDKILSRNEPNAVASQSSAHPGSPPGKIRIRTSLPSGSILRWQFRGIPPIRCFTHTILSGSSLRANGVMISGTGRYSAIKYSGRPVERSFFSTMREIPSF